MEQKRSETRSFRENAEAFARGLWGAISFASIVCLAPTAFIPIILGTGLGCAFFCKSKKQKSPIKRAFKSAGIAFASTTFLLGGSGFIKFYNEPFSAPKVPQNLKQTMYELEEWKTGTSFRVDGFGNKGKDYTVTIVDHRPDVIPFIDPKAGIIGLLPAEHATAKIDFTTLGFWTGEKIENELILGVTRDMCDCRKQEVKPQAQPI